MAREDKLEMRLRDLEGVFLTSLDDVSKNPHHQWHKIKSDCQLGRSKLEPETQELLRLKKEIESLRQKLALPTFTIPNLKELRENTASNKIKICSIPKDHTFAIEPEIFKDAQRQLTQKGLPVFDNIRFDVPRENTDNLVCHCRYNIHTHEAWITFYPLPRSELDPMACDIFVQSILKSLFAFQIEVRKDPRSFKRCHHEVQIFWMETWFSSVPEILPEGADLALKIH